MWRPLAALAAFAALLGLGTSGATALNILVVSTVSSPSHNIFVQTLSAGLLERGHSLTELFIREPAQHPNRTTFLIKGNIYAEEKGFDLENPVTSVWDEIPFFYGFCIASHEFAMGSEAFSDLVSYLQTKKPEIDVFVVDYAMQEALIGLNTVIGRKPVVAITAYNMPSDVLRAMGSPYFPSLLPYGGVGAHGGEPMSFSERLYSVCKWLAYRSYYYWSYRPTVNALLAEKFPGAPSLDELEKDLALALVNTSPALHGSMPITPSIVEVGGLQARPSLPLPDDLLAWVSEKAAPHGFILMAFGTNVKATYMSMERREAILRAFGRLKQRVLWKYEGDDIQDKLPPNVRVAKWLPQNDLLGHPNIRCFVSHNGGLSSQEASYHGVPIVGVPFFADQLLYAEKIERLKLGVRVEYTSLTEETFFAAVNEVVSNPVYRENMRAVRASLRDQKETPLERAVWWVEHVGRTAGARHLRSPALRLQWYQVWMLDVFAVLLVTAAVGLWIVTRVLLAVCTAFSPSRKSRARGRKAKSQ